MHLKINFITQAARFADSKMPFTDSALKTIGLITATTL